MVINQDKFFDGLGFKKYVFRYCYGEEPCYKGPDGGFYRIDHFSKFYVIEYAENEQEARLNRFEDDDLYDDNLPEDELINQIQSDLIKYASE